MSDNSKEKKIELSKDDIEIAIVFLQRVPTQNLKEANDLIILFNRFNEYLKSL